MAVAPLVGAWIEITIGKFYATYWLVAPLVGAWIEIYYFVWCLSFGWSLLSWERGLKSPPYNTLMWHFSSLLSWERGLKFSYQKVSHTLYTVAPLVGAWIEILYMQHLTIWENVAPLVGAWIEIIHKTESMIRAKVAPLVGAWIEMP